MEPSSLDWSHLAGLGDLSLKGGASKVGLGLEAGMGGLELPRPQFEPQGWNWSLEAWIGAWL